MTRTVSLGRMGRLGLHGPWKTIGGAVLSMSVIGGATIVYGAWSTDGGGSTRASSRTAQPVTLAVSSGTADLYPGANGAVYFTVTNPNPYPIRITGATFGTVTSSDGTACPASNVTTTDRSGLALDVGANATSATLSIGSAVTMLSTAPDGCQNKTFTIATTVVGNQV